MQNDDTQMYERLKAQSIDIRNKLLSTQHLDHYMQRFPKAYRGLVRMDYTDALNIAASLPEDMRKVLVIQLDEAYRRAQEYINK